MPQAPAPRPARRSKWRHALDHRLDRIPLYRAALLESMSRFGDDFDLDRFMAAYESRDPTTISAATAVEGNLGRLVNWLRQIGDFGYHELVCLDRIEKRDGRPLDVLVARDIILVSDRERLMRLVAVRNRLQHDYPEVTPQEIHAAVREALELLPGLLGRYREMLELIDG
jgi:hypothetical protein